MTDFAVTVCDNGTYWWLIPPDCDSAPKKATFRCRDCDHEGSMAVKSADLFEDHRCPECAGEAFEWIYWKELHEAIEQMDEDEE